jgi:hypothetical protein
MRRSSLEGRPYRLLAGLPWVLLCGCLGEAQGPGAQPTSVPASRSDLPGAPDFSPGRSGLRRLTVSQYTRSVQALFGASTVVPTELEPDPSFNGFESVAAGDITLSVRATEQYETAALALANPAFQNTTTRAALVGCDLSTAPDTGCARQFLERFGRRAWRRPLTAAEVDRYLGVAQNATQVLQDAWGGMAYAVAGLLQSPHFLFRVELGTADEQHAGWLRYDDFELASRLSFLLTGGPPDDALLQAAANGELSKPGGLRNQAEHLLLLKDAPEAISTFFSELLLLRRLDHLPQDPAVFPNMSPTLGASMREQTLRTLRDALLTRDTDYRELFDGRSTFLNPELASLYGVSPPAGGGFSPVMLPLDGPRAGLLTQASLLALTSKVDATAPPARGRFVRQVLLCQPIPDPPPNVEPLPEPSATARTARERFAEHATNPTCAACHALLDPVGLGLEQFDALGVYRKTENGATIDASGVLDGLPFTDGRALGTAVRENQNLAPCLVRSLYRYTAGRLEEASETPALDLITNRFVQQGHHFTRLIPDLVESEAFRFAVARP